MKASKHELLMRKAVTHVEGNGHVVFSLPEAALESVHVCCRQGHGGLFQGCLLDLQHICDDKAEAQGNK